MSQQNQSNGANEEEKIPEDPPQLPEGEYFSVYLSKKSSPSLIGLGIRTRKDKYIGITEIQEESLASQHPEIRTGDIIMAVNGTSTYGMSKRTLLNLVKATQVGSDIALRLCRPKRRKKRRKSGKSSSSLSQRSSTDQLESDSSDDDRRENARRPTRKISNKRASMADVGLAEKNISASLKEITDAQREQYFADVEAAVESGQHEEVLNIIKKHFEHSTSILRNAPCDPLHMAIAMGSDDMFQFLLNAGVLDINKFSEKYWSTPLFLAVSNGNYYMAEMLLDKGADLHSVNAPQCELLEAIEKEHDTIAMLIASFHSEMQSDADPIFRQRVICHAIRHGREELVYSWFHEKFHTSDKEEHPLESALVGLWLADTDSSKSIFFGIIRFLLNDRGCIITENIAEKFSEPVLIYLNHKSTSSKSGTIRNENSIRWIEKHLQWINFDVWIFPMHLHLTDLNLSLNLMESLPSGIPWLCKNLEKLTVSQCKHLSSLPTGFGKIECMRLCKITITDNPLLEIIPDGWFMLPQLLYANFQNNSISTILDEKSWDCVRLDSLLMSNNNLNSLPDGIKGAIHLKNLDLSQNELSFINYAWSCSLEKLNLSHNQLQAAPESMKRYWDQTLQSLDLSYNQLKSISADLVSLSQIRSLNLSHNDISSLPFPPEVWKCRYLKVLNFSHNNLGAASHNKSESFTTWIVRKCSTSLKPDSASMGSFRERRSESFLGKDASPTSPISPVASLDLTDEEAFPSVFADKLTNLNLSSNNLQRVPRSIGNLMGLNELDISNNPGIREIPIELGKLQNLDMIHLGGLDQIRNLPPSINSKKQNMIKTADLLKYLRSQLRREANYRRLKIIVLGSERSGKSTIVEKLAETSPLLSSECIQTTKCYLFPYDKKKQMISCNVWELRGPETFFPIHQCFMTDKAVYLLVFRLDAIGYFRITSWLITLKARAPNSSVVLIGTHLDVMKTTTPEWEKTLKVTKTTLFEISRTIPGCPKILSFIAFQNDSYNYEKMKKELFDIGDSLISDINVPNSYVMLEAEIEMKKQFLQNKKSIPIIREKEVWNILADIPENDIDTDEDLMNALNVFHRSGLLCYYTESVMAGVESWLYLDPHWLSTQFRTVTMPKDSKRKLLRSEAMKLLEKSCDIQIDFSPLLAVMERFELTVPLSTTQLLIPGRLPPSGPEIHLIQEGSSVCRIYKMTCAAPPGFWSRLIARLLTRIIAPRNCCAQYRSTTSTGHPTLFRQSSSSFHLNMERKSVEEKNLQEAIQLCLYWAEGLFLQTEAGSMKVESFNQNRLSFSCFSSTQFLEGIVITWQWKSTTEKNKRDLLSTSLFSMAIDEVDLLISEWFQNFEYGEERIQRFAVCPMCLAQAFPPTKSIGTEVVETGKQVGCFPLEAVVSASLKTDALVCPVNTHIEAELPFTEFIPDLLLKDIPHLRFYREDDLELKKMIAAGGQGAVFRGMLYNQDEVAAKVFFADRKMMARFMNESDFIQRSRNAQTGASYYFPTNQSYLEQPLLHQTDNTVFRRDFF